MSKDLYNSKLYLTLSYFSFYNYWMCFHFFFPTGTPRRIDINSTSILRRYVKDEVSTNFHVISTYFFDVISLVEKSTSVPRTFFNVISLIAISTFFPSTFFDVNSMLEKFTLFPGTFFNVISLVEKSTLFPLTFFDVILMVEKFTLFARTFG